MGCAGEKRLVPTWVMEEGECRDSLALEVAAQCKLPPDIISRAAALYKVRSSIAVMPGSIHEIKLSST